MASKTGFVVVDMIQSCSKPRVLCRSYESTRAEFQSKARAGINGDGEQLEAEWVRGIYKGDGTGIRVLWLELEFGSVCLKSGRHVRT